MAAAAAKIVRACSGSPFVRAGLVSDHREGRFPSGIYAVTVERISDGFLSWRPLIAGTFPCWPSGLPEPQVARSVDHSRRPLRRSRRDFGASTRGEEPREGLLVLLNEQADRPAAALGNWELAPGSSGFSAVIIEVPVGPIELNFLISGPSAAWSRSRISA